MPSFTQIVQRVKKLNSTLWAWLNFFGDGRFCVQLCIETHYNISKQLRGRIWPTFPLKFFMQFSQKMPLYVVYTMVQKSQKWPKTQIKGWGGGGPASKRHLDVNQKKYIEWSRQHPRTLKFKLHQTLRDRSHRNFDAPKICSSSKTNCWKRKKPLSGSRVLCQWSFSCSFERITNTTIFTIPPKHLKSTVVFRVSKSALLKNAEHKCLRTCQFELRYINIFRKGQF